MNTHNHRQPNSGQTHRSPTEPESLSPFPLNPLTCDDAHTNATKPRRWAEVRTLVAGGARADQVVSATMTSIHVCGRE